MTDREKYQEGQILVSERGIEKIIQPTKMGYISELILPKEVFVEAYKKYIEEEKYDCIGIFRRGEKR